MLVSSNFNAKRGIVMKRCYEEKKILHKFKVRSECCTRWCQQSSYSLAIYEIPWDFKR